MVLSLLLFASFLVGTPYDNKIFRVSRFLLPFLNTLSDPPFLPLRLFLNLFSFSLLFLSYGHTLFLPFFGVFFFYFICPSLFLFVFCVSFFLQFISQLF